MAKLDLNKLKEEIANEKQHRRTPAQLGEGVTGGSPRDEFLNGLITSISTGQETAASKTIKMVENKVAVKNGETASHRINESQPTHQPTQRPAPVNMSPDRDEQLFADLEKKRKQTLAESIQGFNNTQPQGQQQPNVNYNGENYLTAPPAGAPNYQQPQQPAGQLNEGVLVENVKQIVNGHLTESLGPIFEEAIKGTIIEMYAVEQIKKVLGENRDLIKSVVVETIREIQAKNKAKK